MRKILSDILLVSDMDDTLLMPDKSVSAENLEAIAKLRSLGGKFTVATGRSIESFQQYQELLRPDLPVILNNGAVIYDIWQKKIIWNSLLPQTARGYLFEVMERFPEVGAEVLREDGMYIVNLTPIIMDHVRREQLQYNMVSPDKIPTNWFKVLFAMEPSHMEKFNRYLAENNHEDVEYIHSSSRYCEMLPKGSSKGHAMRKLLELINGPAMVVCGAGDYYNDAELILFSHFGVAVQNAPLEICKLADKVVCKNTSHAMVEIVEWLIQKRIRK